MARVVVEEEGIGCDAGWLGCHAAHSRHQHVHALTPSLPPVPLPPSGPSPDPRRYVISVARKIGATVYLTWEDIVEVKQKMVMMLVASVMHRSIVKAAATE